MDHFGIGAAFLAMWRVYIASARQTGRTTSLLDSVKAGDRVIVVTSGEARRLRQLCAERGVDVECIARDPRAAENLFELGTSQGRTLFEHTWLEAYYLATVERAAAQVDHFERELSGYGAAHRETRRRAIELARWRP